MSAKALIISLLGVALMCGSPKASEDTTGGLNELFQLGLQAEANGQYEQALNYFQRGSDAGDALSMERVADYYFSGRACVANPVKALWWLQRSSEAGNVDAAYRIGEHLQKGTDGVKSSQGYAFWWYTQAADMGSVEAIVELAESRMHGRGCKPDMAEGVMWYHKASKLGSVKAQLALAQVYLHGLFDEPNYPKALQELTLAADSGSPEAMLKLSELYYDGRGVQKNRTMAYALFFAAQSRRHETKEPNPETFVFPRPVTEENQVQGMRLSEQLLKIDGVSTTIQNLEKMRDVGGRSGQ